MRKSGWAVAAALGSLALLLAGCGGSSSSSSNGGAATTPAPIGPGAVCVPNRAHLNPSTTPAIGLSPYTTRQCAGSRLLGYTTGEVTGGEPPGGGGPEFENDLADLVRLVEAVKEGG